MNRHSALQSTQLFSMETCNCIQHLMELANKMHNLRIRLRGRDFWLRGMEQRCTYLPAAGNVDNAPLYMTLRTFIDEATAGLEELIGDIDRSLQRRERKGHRKPSSRSQNLREIRRHQNLYRDLRERSMPLYNHICETLGNLFRVPRNFAEWLVPSVQVSNEQANSGDQCTICFEDFEVAETVRQLGCKHCFHTKCLNPWMISNWNKENFTCPLCREPFIARN